MLYKFSFNYNGFIDIMSCSDSTLPSTESSIMGASMTKASTSEELSPEIPECVSEKEDGPAPIADAPASPSIEEQVSPDSDFETYSYYDDVSPTYINHNRGLIVPYD